MWSEANVTMLDNLEGTSQGAMLAKIVDENAEAISSFLSGMLSTNQDLKLIIENNGTLSELINTMIDVEYLSDATGFLQLFQDVYPDEISAVVADMSSENVRDIMREYETILSSASSYSGFKSIFSSVFKVYEELLQDLIDNPQLLVSYLMDEGDEGFGAMEMFNMISNVFNTNSFSEITATSVATSVDEAETVDLNTFLETLTGTIENIVKNMNFDDLDPAVLENAVATISSGNTSSQFAQMIENLIKGQTNNGSTN